ncbi:sensor histidine kinase [Streptomyces kunmingensis]|uniref:histidine kinase n=1 Tax=Streptomyces kunmingensis TaxID=68225 RepID=A0ABU6C8E4_9ACTN|nr:sensor histidine kinase [Streptomyces kunmingensis]MEB3960882.1 sensor histidine kinase [Streptomyces kunmingensis]
MTTFDRLPARVRKLPPQWVDVGVVAVVGVFTGADLAVNEPGYRQADWFSWTLFALSLCALLGRRRWPAAVAAATGAACAAWALYQHIGELLNLPVIVALYTVAVRGSRRRSAWAALIAASVSGVVALAVGKDVVNPQGLPVLEMVWPLVPLLLGEVVRMRRELLAEYAARAVRAETDREREAARRVQEERTRIARELHDVVAHTVAAMTVQAGVALDAFDRRPEMARTAMRTVRDAGKEAVRELRATVSVLREPDGENTAPAPGVDRIADLVNTFAGGGTEITLHQDVPDPTAVPRMVDLAAYRIVQEALTNVVRHANARHTAVSVGRRERWLIVEIVDDGNGRSHDGQATGGGFGLVGMRERASAVGGSIEYGPLPGGGFRVRARLPADPTSAEEDRP